LRAKGKTGPALQCDEQLTTSRLLFIAEFLETRIALQRVHNILGSSEIKLVTISKVAKCRRLVSQ
jgi:hypothetical protein